MREFINKVKLLQEMSSNETPYNYLKGPHNEDLFDGKSFGMVDFNKNIIVKISDLYANQMALDPEALALKRKGKHLTMPMVVRKNNKLILIDGHHTVIAKKLNGSEKVKAKYLDLDNF